MLWFCKGTASAVPYGALVQAALAAEGPGSEFAALCKKDK
jgi:hypothetical protein